MGGYNRYGPTQTSLVLSGNGSWKEGPNLPSRGGDGACSAAWGGSFFLIGGGNNYQVREYDIVKGRWEEEIRWPQLGQGRYTHACSILGTQLIVAGVWEYDLHTLSSTVSLDLASGRGAAWLEGGKLNTPRHSLALVTVGAAGRERLYALGGEFRMGGYPDTVKRYPDTVERWEEGTRMWVEEEERLPEGRYKMGAVAAGSENVCTA